MTFTQLKPSALLLSDQTWLLRQQKPQQQRSTGVLCCRWQVTKLSSASNTGMVQYWQDAEAGGTLQRTESTHSQSHRLTHQEESISVKQHVLRRDACCQGVWALLHKLCRILGRDVLHHNLEVRHLINDGLQPPLNEDFFTVKEVDCRVCDFPMDK